MGKEEATVSPPKERFNRLPDADRERMVAAIEQTPPELLIRPFASAVAERAGADEKFVEELCFFLADWFALLSDNPSEYLERIVKFLAELPEEENRTQQEIETLQAQWRRIMSADATAGVTLKAFDILQRQANAYQKAQTTTEVRPIYRTDPRQAPKHAVLLHQLHIKYRTEFGEQTFHIAIDAWALHQLIEVLQRAVTKEQTLIDQKAYEYLGKVRDA